MNTNTNTNISYYFSLNLSKQPIWFYFVHELIVEESEIKCNILRNRHELIELDEQLNAAYST